ncbi:MAG: hypothetical protein ABGY42_03880, partial [bacterium]
AGIAATTLGQMQPVALPKTGSFRAVAKSVIRDARTEEREQEEAGDEGSAKPTPATQARKARSSVRIPTQLDRDSLLRAYYLALLEEEGRDLHRVAERAGLKLRDLTAEFGRLGVLSEARRGREERESGHGPTGISSHQAKLLP